MIQNVRRRLEHLFDSPVAQGASLVFLTRVGGAALVLLFHILLARLTGPKAYGAYGFATAWMKILATGAGLGLPEAIVRFLPEYRERNQWALFYGLSRSSQWIAAVSALGIALVGTGILALWTGAGPRIFRLPTDLAPTTRALVAGLWCLPALTLARVSTEMCRAVDQITAAYAVSRIGRPTLLILLVLLYTAWSASPLTGTGVVLILGLSVIPIWFLQRQSFYRLGPDRPPEEGIKLQFDFDHWQRVALPLLLVSGSFLVMQETDLVVVGLLTNAERTGIYKAASTLSLPAGFVVTAVNAVAAPRFSKISASSSASLQPFVTRLAHWLFWPTLLAAGGLGVAGELLLRLFGSGFSGGLAPLRILLVSHIVNAGTGSVASLLNMTGHHVDTARVYGTVAVLNIGLSALGTWIFGLVGAALATTLTMILWNMWLLYTVVRQLGVKPSIVSAIRRS